MIQTNIFDLLNVEIKETKKERRKNKKDTKSTSFQQLDIFSMNFSNTEVEPKEEKKSIITKMADKVIELFSFATTITERIDFKLSKRNFQEDLPLKEKFDKNIKAIKLLKKIEFEKRLATKEEQTILAQYIGWGGLAKAFDSKDTTWEKQFKTLKEYLSEEEYASARRSVNTAFYTPISVIRFIYNIIDKLGFQGGKILDPSMGVGYFEGIMPDVIRENSKVEGIELDNVSSRLATQLYQNMKVTNNGYEKTKLKNDSFDIIMSNIPFGDISIYDEIDKEMNDYKLVIHDYYFIKSLKKLRDGGIIAFITSSGTMDKVNDKLRRLLDDKVEFIGAVRLPSLTFKQLSNTEVTSDIIFLKKKEVSEDSESKVRWLNVIETSEGSGIFVNEYYVSNPQMVIGEMKLKSSQFGYSQVCEANKDIDIEKSLDKMVKYFPADIYIPRENDYYMYENEDMLDSSPYIDLKEGGYELIEDKIYQKQGDKLLPCDFKGKQYQVITECISLKKHMLLMIDEQLKNCSDEKLIELQETLNTKYDRFQFANGPINSKCVKVFENDPDYYLLCSLENRNGDGQYFKGAFFTERTISERKSVTHTDNIEDALAVCLNTHGKIDFEFIAKLCDKDSDSVRDILLSKRIIYLDPESEIYELKDAYLSGNVRKKYKIAKEMAKTNPYYTSNVEALESVVPPFIYDVFYQLGSTWIPSQVVKSFIMDLLKIYDETRLNVTYNTYLSIWKVSKDKRLYITDSKMTVEFGTIRKTALNIINDTLNLKDIEIYDTIRDANGNDKRIINPKDTQFARQKQDLIKIEFNKYIEDHNDLKKKLLEIYNDTFNSIVNRKFDGSFLELPGKNPNITLRPHQVDSVARVLFDKNNALLAHVVGSGKTYSMVAAAMELSRLGLSNKTLMVVPNSLVKSGQFANEFYKLYPAAKLLVATEKDFSKKNRRRLINKIATTNYDAIIMAHSSFKLIPISDEMQQEYYNNQIREIKECIDLLDNKEDRFTVKRLEKRKLSLETKAAKLMDIKRDDTLNFEKLGIQYLFVDEFHRFKSLYIYSANLAGISGVPNMVSDKAMDMHLKITYLNEKYNYKAVAVATGTPISNSMAELYTNMKYLIPQILNEQGLNTFDAWASTYGQVVSALEVTPTGKGFRANKRFAKFNNVPELMKLFRECSDIITADMVNLKLPKIRTGKPIIEQILPTDEMKEFVDTLVTRAEAIYNGSVKPWEDNMLSVTGDGRMMAVDPRLVGIDTYSIADTPKIERITENVYKEWKDGRHKKLTQLIFSDLGTPSGNCFNFYEAIRTTLVEMGIPKGEVKFIHEGNTDDKRAKLLDDVREGNVRILIGSTDKMGEGMNIQQKLVALHNCDCPWRPSDVEQRVGRIVRQLNTNEEVAIYNYVVKGSFDAYSWQTIERKAKYIDQIMSGTSDARSVEDITEKTLSYQETKAIAADNPIVFRKFEIDSEIQHLLLLKRAFSEQKSRIIFNIDSDKEKIADTLKVIELTKADMAIANENTNSEFEIKIGETVFDERVAAGDAILEIIKQFVSSIGDEEIHLIGQYKGFELYYEKVFVRFNSTISKSLFLKGNIKYKAELSFSSIGNITKIENLIKNLSDKIDEKESYVTRLKTELENFELQTHLSFDDEAKLKELLLEQSQIDNELAVNSGIIGAGVDVEEEITTTNETDEFETA